MGVIKSQSIKSTIITYFGFVIGTINMIFVMPRFFTNEQYGLIQVFIAFAMQAVTIGSLGMTIVTNKFLPYYKTHLPPQKRDLLTIALVTGTIGMIIIFVVAYFNQNLIVIKFSKNSPLFVQYMYLFPLFAMGYFYYYILESFNNNYKFTVWSSFVREIFYRSFNLIAAVVFALGLLTFEGVINLYMAMYWLGALLLVINLYYNHVFYLPFKFSSLTRRLRKNIIKYSVSSWSTNVLSATFQFIETLAIAGLMGLGPAAVYTVAKFIITPIVIPSTSVMSISLPLISDAWRRKDLKQIGIIYKKTSLVLMMICGFIFFLIGVNVTGVLHLIPQKFFGSENLFEQAKWAIFVLGLGRIMDFSTSVNSYILQNSRKYFYIDLSTNIVSVILSIPLNYFLIKTYGIIGAALAYFVLAFLANSFKALYLYIKERLLPFSGKWLLLFLSFIISAVAAYFINLLCKNLFIESQLSVFALLVLLAVKCVLLCIIYIPMVYWYRISEDINTTIDNIIRKTKRLIKI